MQERPERQSFGSELDEPDARVQPGRQDVNRLERPRLAGIDIQDCVQPGETKRRW
jgi:hypothetical protein